MLAAGAAVLLAIVVAIGVAPPRPAGSGAALRTPRADEVIAAVRARAPGERTARRQAAAGDVAAAARIVREDLALARRLGDPRYLGHAKAALAHWADQLEPPPPLGLLRATVAQALHDFAGARLDLDRLLARDPTDAQAHLTRAVVALVTGDRSTAEADCAAVTATAGELWGAACAAPLVGYAGGGPAGRARLHQALRHAGRDPGVAWARTALADLDRQLGDEAAAELGYRTAVALDPADLYTQAALADLLLAAHRDAEVVALLAEATADHLVLRRAIALHRTAGADARRDVDGLRARFAAGAARGDRLHQREHAMFLLAIERQPAAALTAALTNWELQRELADARLVVATAVAAGDRAAAAPVLAWLRAAQIDDAIMAADRAALEGQP